MRQVTTHSLCSVCLEGLWLHLLARVSLLDRVVVERYTDEKGDIGHKIQVDPIPLLFEKTEIPAIAKDGYAITWYRDGHELSQFANQSSIDVGSSIGIYETRVRLLTEEIRKDVNNYTLAKSVVYIRSESTDYASASHVAAHTATRYAEESVLVV